ncbi:MAG: phosphodiester glycosidase family protein [Saprospiraceae bacterium]
MQFFDLLNSLLYRFKRATYCLLLMILPILLTAQKDQLPIKWKDFNKEKIHPGLKWYHLQTSTLYTSEQSINLLQVETNKRSVDLIYQPDTLITTSAYAKAVNAKAAVNAGFFNMKEGGSVTYLKKDGQVLAENQADLKSRGSVVIRGAVVINQNGKTQIETPQTTTNYTQASKVDDVLLSGPLLIENGQSIILDSTKFNLDRHPRTSACTTKGNRLLLVTIDGRNEQAAGMSLPEMTQFLVALGCKNAINLDGGGSTTMYIEGKTSNGIVNYPSDNRQFDHEGQRKVSNVLVVH